MAYDELIVNESPLSLCQTLWGFFFFFLVLQLPKLQSDPTDRGQLKLLLGKMNLPHWQKEEKEAVRSPFTELIGYFASCQLYRGLIGGSMESYSNTITSGMNHCIFFLHCSVVMASSCWLPAVGVAGSVLPAAACLCAVLGA